MNILVTGGAGYLGSVLLPKLLSRGHKVKALDLGYFGLGHLRALRPAVELIREDLRDVTMNPARLRELLSDCDCVIHLAAISNDPSAELNPELTEEVNFRATQILAETAKGMGVKFIFSSSCSVYGEADAEIDENGDVAPLTVYASSKVKAEEVILEIASPTWSPVILRNGTLFGYIAEIFKRLNPSLAASHLPLPEDDRRDYAVSTERIKEEGFNTRIGVEMGAEEMIEAIVSGLIPDPESVFYRNAKWLKELTQIGSKDHRELVGLLETIAQVRPKWDRL